ncbi:MAG: hypothetical protein V1789_11585 [PVC group bacterium]
MNRFRYIPLLAGILSAGILVSGAGARGEGTESTLEYTGYRVSSRLTAEFYNTPRLPGSLIVRLANPATGRSLLFTGDFGSGLSPFLCEVSLGIMAGHIPRDLLRRLSPSPRNGRGNLYATTAIST